MLRKTAWGLDLGRSAIKGVLIAADDDGVEILKADIVPLEGPPPDASQDPTRDGRLWRALREFRRRHPLHRAPTCVAIPAQNTFARDLTIATVSSRRAEEMVRYEAANEIPFVLDEVAWDYLLFDQRPGEPTQEGMLLAVKRNVVETYVRVFSQLEIGHLDIITLAPLALVDFLRLELRDTGRTLVLDIGADNTNMLLMADGRFWMRTMLAGGNRVTALLQEEFELEFEEAERAKQNIARSKLRRQIIAAARPAVHELVRNVKTNLSHLERTGGPAELDAAFTVGGAGRLPGVREVLGNALRRPVHGLDELKHIVVSPEADAGFIGTHLDQLAVAIGAGLCGVGRDSIGVSFLPKAGMRVGRLSRAKGLLFGIGLVLWLAMLTFYVLGRQASAAVQGPLDEYNKLALIAAHNQRELKQAMDREQEQNGLQRLVSLPRGRTQALQMLSDVVDTFAAASRASTYRFLLTRYEWQDADTVAALAKAARPPADERRGQQRTAQPEPEAESTSPAPEQPASKLLVGEVSGVIRLPRGGSPREAYRSFLNDFVEGLRNRASLRMATATGKFTKGSTTVELAEGPWFGVVAAGDMVRPLPDGQWCLLAGVTSETELALAEPFEGKDCQVPCAFSRVSPLGFNGEALEFSVRFVVPKAPAVELFARGGPGE